RAAGPKAAGSSPRALPAASPTIRAARPATGSGGIWTCTPPPARSSPADRGPDRPLSGGAGGQQGEHIAARRRRGTGHAGRVACKGPGKLVGLLRFVILLLIDPRPSIPRPGELMTSTRRRRRRWNRPLAAGVTLVLVAALAPRAMADEGDTTTSFQASDQGQPPPAQAPDQTPTDVAAADPVDGPGT